jgi:hypothetical protein
MKKKKIFYLNLSQVRAKMRHLLTYYSSSGAASVNISLASGGCWRKVTSDQSLQNAVASVGHD